MTKKKILRDSIKKITNSSLKHISQKAGVKYVNKKVYEYIKALLRLWLANVIRDAVVITEYYTKLTINEGCINAALSNLNENRGWINPGKKIKACKIKSTKKSTKNSSKNSTKNSSKKKRKISPGKKSLSAIRYYQRQSDCLLIPPTSFRRLVKEITQDFNVKLRYSPGSIELLQFMAENYLLRLFEAGNLNAVNTESDTVEVKDIGLALRIIQ